MLLCENCENPITKEDDFCPRCGTLYSKIKCETHSQTEAEGVCLVCQKICCSRCGQYVNGTYLCNDHSDIEVYQGMGRVYGSSDAVEVDYIISFLESNDKHPFKFNRKNTTISMGGVDFSLFRASGDYNGHIINEVKILVPLNEYTTAEKLINELLSSEE